jgi:hypothetical protein
LPASAVESDLGCAHRAIEGFGDLVERHFRNIVEQHDPPAVKR